MYEIVFTKQAVKDAAKLERHNLKSKAMNLIRLIRTDPFAYPPPFEYLGGKMKGLISRRINRQHRLVYEVFEYGWKETRLFLAGKGVGPFGKKPVFLYTRKKRKGN